MRKARQRWIVEKQIAIIKREENGMKKKKSEQETPRKVDASRMYTYMCVCVCVQMFCASKMRRCANLFLSPTPGFALSSFSPVLFLHMLCCFVRTSTQCALKKENNNHFASRNCFGEVILPTKPTHLLQEENTCDWNFYFFFTKYIMQRNIKRNIKR